MSKHVRCKEADVSRRNVERVCLEINEGGVIMNGGYGLLHGGR